MNRQEIEVTELIKGVPEKEYPRVTRFLKALTWSDPKAIDLLRRTNAGEFNFYAALDRFECDGPA